MLALDEVEPTFLLDALQVRRSGFGQVEVGIGVPPPDRVGLAARLQPLQGKLADRDQHAEARLAFALDLT